MTNDPNNKFDHLSWIASIIIVSLVGAVILWGFQ